MLSLLCVHNIYSLSIEKDGRASRNISIQFLCDCVCLSFCDLFNSWKFSLSFPLICDFRTSVLSFPRGFFFSLNLYGFRGSGLAVFGPSTVDRSTTEIYSWMMKHLNCYKTARDHNRPLGLCICVLMIMMKKKKALTHAERPIECDVLVF